MQNNRRDRITQNSTATDELVSLDDEETTNAKTNGANQLRRRISPHLLNAE